MLFSCAPKLGTFTGKGIAALIVPYQRRRRVEMMLRGAKIDTQWVEVPTVEMIRAAVASK